MGRDRGLIPALRMQREKRTKSFPRFEPRNPLKNLDSDERIQGNPRQSNPHQQGGQENPNATTGTTARRFAAEKEPNRLLPNAKQAGASPVRTSRVCYIMPHLFQLQKNEPKPLKRLRRAQN
jgi:hypothetical protein